MEVEYYAKKSIVSEKHTKRYNNLLQVNMLSVYF